VLSVVGGWIGWPASLGGSNQFEKFLEPVIFNPGSTEFAKAAPQSLPTEYLLMIASIAIAVAGIWLAYQLYLVKRFAPELVAGKMRGFYRVLFHKYYVDEIYDALVVNRTKDLGTLLGQLDAKVIDGVGVDGTGWLARFGSTLSIWWDKWIIDGLLNFGAKLTQLLSFPIRFLQTGTFSTYALLILIGLAILLAYYQQHLHVVLRGAR
jgi:NADH-quinone oxidoreductase subunit L